MYFSKKVHFIFIILIAKIILLNARYSYMQRSVAHGASMRSDYIEGLLKLKSRMLANAMQKLHQQQADSEYDAHHKLPGEQKQVFNDLGSHPIATPRTLHAEDFTSPPVDMFTEACRTTTEAEPVTAVTSRMQYHRPNLQTTSRADNREEDMTTVKHNVDMEEVTQKSNTTHVQHPDENHEEETVTKINHTENEADTAKCNKVKEQPTDKNRDEEEVTKKQRVEAEEVTQEHKETDTETSTHSIVKCKGERPNTDDNETNMEKPNSKEQPSTTPNTDQSETTDSPPKKQNETNKSERLQSHRNEETTEKQIEHKSTEHAKHNVEESTTESTQEKEDDVEECEEESEEESATTESVSDKTTCGPDEEEVKDTAYHPQLRFIIIEPVTTNTKKQNVGPVNVERTTCGPDEEEVEEEGSGYQQPFKMTVRVIEPATVNPLANSKAQTSVTATESAKDSLITQETSAGTTSSPMVYQTMCFPVTAPAQVNNTQAVTTRAYQNVLGVTVPPSNGTREPTAQQGYQTTSTSMSQPTLVNTTQNATTQGYLTTPARANEITTSMKPASVTQEGTTQSPTAFATMCFPITEPPIHNATTPQSVASLHAQRRRRFYKQRRQSRHSANGLIGCNRPSMRRVKLKRVVRELKERENKPVDSTKTLTPVDCQPRYQRYYLRGLKGSTNLNRSYKKYENAEYPDEENGPKFVRGNQNVDIPGYEEPNEDDQTGIFEDAMKVKMPFCPNKTPPPQLIADKCAGKNHNIQHFNQKSTTKYTKPASQCNIPCEDQKDSIISSPFIMPIPQIGSECNDSSKQKDGDDANVDPNFSTDDFLGSKLGETNSCNLDLPQFKKKSQAEISLENFRKGQENDPIQQKLSFMGRLLGRISKCGNTNKPPPPHELTKEPPGEKSENVSTLQRLFGKWIKPKQSCDKCHQKAKLKDLLHHKNSIKMMNEGNVKYKRQKDGQVRNLKLEKRNEITNSEQNKEHPNERSKTALANKSSKAASEVRQDEFVVEPRRHSALRRSRQIPEESNSHLLDWQNIEVPDLSLSWEGNVDLNDYNIF